jgi:hypothetical protein
MLLSDIKLEINNLPNPLSFFCGERPLQFIAFVDIVGTISHLQEKLNLVC